LLLTGLCKAVQVGLSVRHVTTFRSNDLRNRSPDVHCLCGQHLVSYCGPCFLVRRQPLSGPGNEPACGGAAAEHVTSFGTHSHRDALTGIPPPRQVLEVDAHASVQDMIHAAIHSYGTQATLREVRKLDLVHA
jgi:hypothetical protein